MKMYKLLTIILIILITLSCARYEEYQPLFFNGENIIVKPELMTTEHKQNVIQVLNYYGENWKEEDGKIYVSSDIDIEKLWNYTTKANDPEWLITHKKP